MRKTNLSAPKQPPTHPVGSARRIRNKFGNEVVVRSASERFNDNVMIDAAESECWIWIGSCHEGRYMFTVDCGQAGDGARPTRVTMSAHRFAWLNDGRDLPENMTPRPTCGNPVCVNPDHQTLKFAANAEAVSAAIREGWQ